MTSNHHAPYDLGYTRATMVCTEGSERATWSESQKADLSSDCRLQLAYMKSESLESAVRLPRGKRYRALFPPAVTPPKFATREAGGLNVRREPSKVGQMIGVKS